MSIRKEGESYEAYKVRIKEQNQKRKQERKGAQNEKNNSNPS